MTLDEAAMTLEDLDGPGGGNSLQAPLALRQSRGGQPAGKPLIGEITALTLDDLYELENPDRARKGGQELLKIRNSHHQLARLLASGVKQSHCSQILGYAPSRISILQNDPAFADLLEFYSARTDEVHLDLVKRLHNLSADAMEVIHERVLEAPEEITVANLLEIVKMGADRSGAGPKSTSVVEHQHTLNAGDLLRLKKGVIDEENKIIDVSPVDGGRSFSAEEPQGDESPGGQVREDHWEDHAEGTS